jgi:sec-independent protein translocase protein TatB
VVASVPVFGFSLSELIVVIVVALVVIGPKDLPKMLRKLGQYSGKLRRMASDLRAQSGIDEALRTEGLADPIAEIRKLARGELDAVTRAVDDPGVIAGPRPPDLTAARDGFYVMRDREYPRDGADSYGALPDNAIVYAEGLPKSKLARDPLYMLGDADGVVPEPPPPPVFGDDLRPPELIEAEERALAEAAAAAPEPEGAADPSEAETMDPPAVAERPANEAH